MLASPDPGDDLLLEDKRISMIEGRDRSAPMEITYPSSCCSCLFVGCLLLWRLAGERPCGCGPWPPEKALQLVNVPLLIKREEGKMELLYQPLDNRLLRVGCEGPVTCTFLEALVTSLKADLSLVKKVLSQDLKEFCSELREVEDRVKILREHETKRDEKVEQLQQEVLQLREQHIDLQAHTEDL
ncbi:hypothetical protein NDU88_006417 [Pleurodeles waltl]|uniref:Uncharacterized protein n=1 Tax=Pleurodeles waltl TaxID=8319 RepID=A0AAV7X1G9_PLEWA|nr:hypothetical protein NDU88_006417 [Pleurodeles waltl]